MNPPHPNLEPPLHPMPPPFRPFALVTGASSGIGYHLALECARADFDLLVAADEPAIERSAPGRKTIPPTSPLPASRP